MVEANTAVKLNSSLSFLFSREQSPNPNTLGYMLCVIGQIAKHLPRSTRDRVTGGCNRGCLEKALPFL